MSRELGTLEVIYSTDVLGHTHTLAHSFYVLITNALEMREAAWGGRPCRTRHVSFAPPGHLMGVFCDAQDGCVRECVCV